MDLNCWRRFADSFGAIGHSDDGLWSDQPGGLSHAARALDYLVKPFSGEQLVSTPEQISGQVVSEVESDQPVAADPASKRVFQLAQRVCRNGFNRFDFGRKRNR